MAAVTTYSAHATREGRWWVVDVEGVGVTQARTLPDAQIMAADLISALRNIEVAPTDVDIDVEVEGGLVMAARMAQEQARQAATAARAAAEEVSAQVRKLRERGLTGKDAAFVLGVSEQRISQLVKRVSSEHSTQVKALAAARGVVKADGVDRVGRAKPDGESHVHRKPARGKSPAASPRSSRRAAG
jgi:hypothetical protein